MRFNTRPIRGLQLAAALVLIVAAAGCGKDSTDALRA